MGEHVRVLSSLIARSFVNIYYSQTQALEFSSLPTLNDKISYIKKKADFAWVFSREHTEVTPLYQAISFAGKNMTLSQVTDTYTKRVVMFCGIEVKKSGGNAQESQAQLAI